MSSDIEKWPAPEDPVAFESLCLDLWKEIWKDSGAKKTGRRGQTQDGVDISGCAEGRQMGVQCKKKDGHLRYKLTIAELEKAVTKAKSFSPKLDVLTIATTGPKDAAIVRIPMKSDTDSDNCRTPIPEQIGQSSERSDGSVLV